MRCARLAGALALLVLAPPAGASDPAAIDYMLQCQGCHLPGGEGTPGSVPRLRGSVGRFLLVPGGREYLVRVPGSAQSPLSDAALARVLNWMVESYGPPEVARDFERFTPEEIARVRRPALLDVEPLRTRLLEAIERAEATPATGP